MRQPPAHLSARATILVLASFTGTIGCAQPLVAQGIEPFNDQHQAWLQVGFKDPMTDEVRWYPAILTRVIAPGGDAKGPYIEGADHLAFLCGEEEGIAAGFLHKQPIRGLIVREGDSLRVQLRFDSAPALDPWWFRNEADDGDDPTLVLRGEQVDQFAEAAKRHSLVLLQAQSGNRAENYRFSLLGFAEMLQRCRARS